MRKLPILGALLVSTLLFAACGGAPTAQTAVTPASDAAAPATTVAATAAPAQAAASTEKVTLNLWFYEGYQEFLPELKKGFEAKHPNITLEITQIPEEQYVTKVDTALAAGDPPDLGLIYERRWIKAGKMLPLDDLVAEKAIKLDTFNQGIIKETCTYENKLYCIGSYTGAVVLFYNKDMFDAAGIPYPSATEPMSIDDYVALGAKLTKPNSDPNQQVWGTANGLPYTWLAWDTMVSDDGRKTAEVINSAEMVHVYDIVAKMFRDGHAPSLSVMDPWQQGSDYFAQKKLAMVITDFQSLSKLEQAGIKYGVAPVPVPKGEDPWVTVWTDAWGIFAGSDHPAEAQAFMHYVATEAQHLRVKITGDVPLDSRVADELNWAGDQPGRQEFLQVFKLARPGIFVPNRWDVAGPLDDAFNQIVEGEQPAQDAIADAAPQMQERLDKAWETWDQVK